MSTAKFPRIGVFAKPTGDNIVDTVKTLLQFLTQDKQHSIVLETKTAAMLDNIDNASVVNRKILGAHCDLLIVVGGDGTILKAGRAIVDYQVPIIGINRGTLGFMTDISPDQIHNHLGQILAGQYDLEERCVLHVDIIRNGKKVFANKAINDVVLYNADRARLIEFTIFIDEQFVMHQRSDGIITATPTGSTAYALSAGGPILDPSLQAFTLVSLNPHTLTSRPIVIKDSSIIRLVLPNKQNLTHKIACDGQRHITLTANDEICIKKHSNSFKIMHPLDHNHFALLRNKLGWGTHVGV